MSPTPPQGQEASPALEVTVLLARWRDGDQAALDELVPVVYGELRVLAARYLRSERGGHTLQPTSLVNEAFVRLLGPARVRPQDRTHFFALAARTMRRVLVDHARRRQAEKRPAPEDRLTLVTAVAGSTAAPEIDLLALHEALERLAAIHPRQARLVELRYFGGLSNREAAEALEVSLATVERDWQVARLWLADRLGGAAGG
jgi:RNA polymerase sigma factor (TIGR02999 family)